MFSGVILSHPDIIRVHARSAKRVDFIFYVFIVKKITTKIIPLDIPVKQVRPKWT
jgi:hypothetical protein